MNSAVETSTMRKVTWRIIPFLSLLYFVNFLDRVNVSFAALTMNKALNFTATVFGTGAGIFFIAYCLFEVPANLIGAKVGLRRWMCRIMVTWGLISAATAFVTGETSFYVVRFLLGLGEAGFAPGILLYATFWFPEAYRAKLVGLYLAAIPVSSLFGAPLSGFIIDQTGSLFGLAGWQWLFILEGLPAVLLGILSLWVLTDLPAQANWLAAEERQWLQNTLDKEARDRASVRTMGFLEVCINPTVLLLTLSYIFVVIGLYGVSFFLPQIVKGFGGLSNTEVGFISAIPFVGAVISMVLWTRHSDAKQERIGHLAAAMVTGGVGLILASLLLNQPILAMLAICLSSAGIYAVLPMFWTVPMAILSGTAAAGGIAYINSFANLGGYFGPTIFGFLRDSTGSFTIGLVLLGCLQLVAAAIVVMVGSKLALKGAAVVGGGAAKTA